jgi:hypothetical protein
MDNKNINSNKSDWLKKIKGTALPEEDYEESFSNQDVNEIEVELKNFDDENKEGIEISSEKEGPQEKEEKIIEEQLLIGSSLQEDDAPDIQNAEISENVVQTPNESAPDEPTSMETVPIEPTPEETVSDLLTIMPKNLYAHFLLININSSVKEIRELPRYIPINNIRTLIGRYSKAHIILDDPNSIEVKHARMVFEDRDGKKDFYMYPINNAMISINGEVLANNGKVLKSGDLVKIGSADLIFFYHQPDEVK